MSSGCAWVVGSQRREAVQMRVLQQSFHGVEHSSHSHQTTFGWKTIQGNSSPVFRFYASWPFSRSWVTTRYMVTARWHNL